MLVALNHGRPLIFHLMLNTFSFCSKKLNNQILYHLTFLTLLTFVTLLTFEILTCEGFSSKRYLTHIFVKTEIWISGEETLYCLPLCMIWK